MRKLETKIIEALPFGKAFFVFGLIFLGNGAKQLENGINKKSCTAYLCAVQEKNKHTMRKLVTNVCIFIPMFYALISINL
jgi:hypothetical protein